MLHLTSMPGCNVLPVMAHIEETLTMSKPDHPGGILACLPSLYNQPPRDQSVHCSCSSACKLFLHVQLRPFGWDLILISMNMASLLRLLQLKPLS